MNRNLFDFAEEKFLEQLPTTINEVKKVLDEIKTETYHNEQPSENNIIESSIGSKQLVRVREINGAGSTMKEVQEPQVINNYPKYQNYTAYQNTSYTNQNGLSTVLTFMLVILLIALVFAVSTFIFKVV